VCDGPCGAWIALDEHGFPLDEHGLPLDEHGFPLMSMDSP
jgi:hypothetical protein